MSVARKKYASQPRKIHMGNRYRALEVFVAGFIWTPACIQGRKCHFLQTVQTI